MRPGEWTEDSLAALVASYRDELRRRGAPAPAIAVATERDDRGGISVIATWVQQPVTDTEDSLHGGTSVLQSGFDDITNPAPVIQIPHAGIQGNATTTSRKDLDGLIQSKGNVISIGGDTIGGIGQIYVDDATDRPGWVTVATGLVGTRESCIPLKGARIEGSDIIVPYSKALIEDAPRIEPDAGTEQRPVDADGSADSPR